MGRQQQYNEPTVNSSIALLQERFRQLQRVKEMREERELMRVFTEPESPLVATAAPPPKWFIHPDLLHPSPSLPRGGKDFQAHDTQLSMGLWPASKKPNGTYVDTSLHL